MQMQIAAIYAGLNIILLILLSLRVSLQRRKHKVSLGDGGVDELRRAIRAHGNAVEFIGPGLAGLAILALNADAVSLEILHAAGATLTAGRVLHAAGLSAGEVNIGRMAGSGLTLLSFGILAYALLNAGLAAR